MENEVKKESIAPTLTLAQLYDSQNQLFNALQIYNKLLGIGDDAEVKERINGIYEKLVTKDFETYNSLTKSIFSKKDMINFKILTASQYENYMESLEKMESESDENEETIPDDIKEEQEPILDDIEEEIKTEEKVEEPFLEKEEAIRNIEDSVQKKEMSQTKNYEIKKDLSDFSWQEMKMGDLIDFITLKIDRDRSLGSITLKDIKDIINIFR